MRPHLDHWDVIYDIPAKVCEFRGSVILPSLMEKLESVQYSAARAITGTWRGKSREKLYSEIGLESLSCRRWSRRLTLLYKIINNLTPVYTKDPIPPLQQPHYSLRNQDVVEQIKVYPHVFLIGLFRSTTGYIFFHRVFSEPILTFYALRSVRRKSF